MSADTTKNAVVWFEIPATNFARAVAFYETILGVSLKKETMGPNELAVFPYSEGEGVSGCVISGAGYLPAKEGAVVYLHAESGVDAVLSKVNAAGGMVLLGKTALPPGMGFFAHMLDTEGNRVGLHSLK
ncbi:MAG: VOC family protein [Usitatibacteraceae bacterium]